VCARGQLHNFEPCTPTPVKEKKKRLVVPWRSVSGERFSKREDQNPEVATSTTNGGSIALPSKFSFCIRDVSAQMMARKVYFVREIVIRHQNRSRTDPITFSGPYLGTM